MRNLVAITAAIMIGSAAPALAQAVESTVTAANGVEVTVHSDEFANRYEYTAPTIKFPNLGGFAIVARVDKGGVSGPVEIVGSIMYQGDWRRYHSAILRGGEAVEATFNDRDVVSCRGSRYSGCSLREGFELRPTPAQVTKFAQGGTLDIQIRAQAGEAVLIPIPVSHIEAIRAVGRK